MAKDSLFRTSLQGFNKQDVLDYIENLNVRYNKQSEVLEGEILELKKELEKLPELIRAKESYDKLKEENELLLKEKNDLDQALKAQSKVLEEKEQLLEEAFAENSEYAEKLRNMENGKAVSSEDSQDTESLSKEFEGILSQARNEAKSEIMKAQELARDILDNAKEKAKVHEEEAKEKAQEAIKQSDRAVRDNLKKVKYLNRKKDELSNIFMSHKSQMESFFTSITQSLKGE